MSKQPATAGSPHPSVEDNRILVISRVGGPPPHRGNRTRMAALLTEMRRLGYAVHFASVRMTAEEKAATRPLVDEWVADFEYLPPPWGWARLRASLEYRARRWLGRFRFVGDRLDDLFSDHWLGEAQALQQRRQYARVLVPYVYHSRFLLAFPDPCLKILDTIDAFSIRRPQLRAGKADGHLRAYSPADEKRGLLRAQRVIAIQEREAAYFRQLVGSACQIYTVGHFAEPLTQPPALISRLGCIGSSAWLNGQGLQWFLREAWPAVRTRLPTVELWVAGGVCDQCEPAPGLRLLGKIPRLADFYRDCSVLINPMRAGTGLKIKTIEALMHGRPVVTTSIGAEGLDSFVGQGLLVGNAPEEFANAVVHLLSNLLQAQQLGEAALRCVQSYGAENRRALAAALAA